MKIFSKAFCNDTNEEIFCRCWLFSWGLTTLNTFKSMSTSIFCAILVASKRLMMLQATNSYETPNAFFTSYNSGRKGKTTFMVTIFWDIFMFWQIFLSVQVKRSAIISNKHGLYKLPYELSNDLEIKKNKESLKIC